jgi:hypothetical protein
MMRGNLQSMQTFLFALLLFISPQLSSAQTRNTGDHAGIPPTSMSIGNWVKEHTTKEPRNLNLSWAFTNSLPVSARQISPQKRKWIGRHPMLFGSLIGFGAGFLAGYLPGDDGVFHDFTAGFNGLVLGGIGAGAGAIVGYTIEETRAKPRP